MRLVLVPLALLLAPLASAGSAPALHFLQDGEMGPAGDGMLGLEWPHKNESSMRLVVPEPLNGPVGTFAANATWGTHLKGPLFIGIWHEAPLAQDAQIRVVLLVDGEEVAQGHVAVGVDPATAPDPMSLVPPDPLDPQAAVMHVVGKAAPLVLRPPTLVDMGMVDVEVPADAAVEVAFALVGAGGAPPQGVSALLKYDALLTPSYVYVPWWSADEEVRSPQVPAPVRRPAPPAEAAKDDGPAEVAGKDSPAGLLLGFGALGAAWALRRR